MTPMTMSPAPGAPSVPTPAAPNPVTPGTPPAPETPPAPVTPPAPETPVTPRAAGPVEDESTLFTPMAAKRKTLVLPDSGRTILLEALSPKEYDELNHAATVTDQKDGSQSVDNRMWNARFVARAIRRANGTKMFKDDASWRYLAQQIASFWTVGDCRVAAEAAADVTGVSAEARKAQDAAVGKGSAGTATIGGSTT